MIREAIVLLVTLAMLAVPIQAEAVHDSGPCSLHITVGSEVYTGAGEWKKVVTPSGNVNIVCQGQLDSNSDVPDEAIKIDNGNIQWVITPGGHFTKTVHQP